jgi:hypothetical protein
MDDSCRFFQHWKYTCKEDVSLYIHVGIFPRRKTVNNPDYNDVLLAVNKHCGLYHTMAHVTELGFRNAVEATSSYIHQKQNNEGNNIAQLAFSLYRLPKGQRVLASVY